MSSPITQMGNPGQRAPGSAPAFTGLLSCLALHPQPWCPSPLMCQPLLSTLAALAGCTNGHGLAEHSDLIKAADRILLLPSLVLPEAQDAQINSQDVTDTVLLCLSSSPARCEVSQGPGHAASASEPRGYPLWVPSL